MAEHGSTPEDSAVGGTAGSEKEKAAPFHAARAARLTSAVAALHLSPAKRPSAAAAPRTNPWLR
ncbi:hypothetical protein ADL22_10695 [Streptomyces sp. NRRL F-4489]|uniref:hypothetical protein n=1 Tax=Streptomyces sp. NRRL F-4489 TaxID=1609095 RepID=UPI000746F4B1|nr:hypothetical protein [Streptomyces sp. NRRL F-4489]KUL45989.1 hypothetical protein ADL22_10695 [Streptomyces sp. NRRL F-4489]